MEQDTHKKSRTDLRHASSTPPPEQYEATRMSETRMIPANPSLSNQEEIQSQQAPETVAQLDTEETDGRQSPSTQDIIENEAIIASLRDENESLRSLLETTMQEQRLLHQAMEIHIQQAMDRNSELIAQVEQIIAQENQARQANAMQQLAPSSDQSNNRMVANVPEDVILSLLAAEYTNSSAGSGATQPTAPVANNFQARRRPRQENRSRRNALAAQFASSLMQSSESARSLAGDLQAFQSSRSGRNHNQGRGSQRGNPVVQRPLVNDEELNLAQEELIRLQAELNALKRKRGS